MTHTYAKLNVSPAFHSEVTGKLKAAGYSHAFDGDVIDMHGIALVPDSEEPKVSQEMVDAWKTAFHASYDGGKGESGYDDHVRAGLVAALSVRANNE